MTDRGTRQCAFNDTGAGCICGVGGDAAPQFIRHHYELAELYRITGRTGKAIEEYQRTVTLPAVLALDHRTQNAARQWLEELGRNN